MRSSKTFYWEETKFFCSETRKLSCTSIFRWRHPIFEAFSMKRYSRVEYYQTKKLGKIEKMKMKNKEEENRLLVELCYNHQFLRSDSSILDHLRNEKIFQKYPFNRKISNKVYRWLTLKGSKNDKKTAFWQSTNNKFCLISFD